MNIVLLKKTKNIILLSGMVALVLSPSISADERSFPLPLPCIEALQKDKLNCANKVDSKVFSKDKRSFLFASLECITEKEDEGSAFQLALFEIKDNKTCKIIDMDSSFVLKSESELPQTLNVPKEAFVEAAKEELRHLFPKKSDQEEAIKELITKSIEEPLNEEEQWILDFVKTLSK